MFDFRDDYLPTLCSNATKKQEPQLKLQERRLLLQERTVLYLHCLFRDFCSLLR